MKEIKTSFGSLYIEEENDKREEGRIKIYDSLMRYFDYFSLDNLGEGETVASLVEDVVKGISACSSVEELLDYLGINAYAVSKDWADLLEDMYGGLAEFHYGSWIDISNDSIITEATVLANEWVNKMGDTYIFVSEI